MNNLELRNRGDELCIGEKFDSDDELSIDILSDYPVYYATREQVEKLYNHLKGVLGYEE